MHWNLCPIHLYTFEAWNIAPEIFNKFEAEGVFFPAQIYHPSLVNIV